MPHPDPSERWGSACPYCGKTYVLYPKGLEIGMAEHVDRCHNQDRTQERRDLSVKLEELFEHLTSLDHEDVYDVLADLILIVAKLS